MVKNLKCRCEGEFVRLTWDWPLDIKQVYIYVGSAEGRLFTLQEYKKQSGCRVLKGRGQVTYRVAGFTRENGIDIFCPQDDDSNIITFTAKTTVTFTIKYRMGTYNNYVITLSADGIVPPNVICYVKREGSHPSDINDGILYYITSSIIPNYPITRVVHTQPNEYINLFISSESLEALYEIQR